MHITIVYKGDAVTGCITFKDAHQLLCIVAHHPNINVIVPRDKAPMAYGPKQRTERQPVIKAVLTTQRIKLMEELGATQL